MRKCMKCGEYIPWRVKIDGKFKTIRKRKFCLKCSPWGSNNRKNLLISDDERIEKRKDQNRKKAKKYRDSHSSSPLFKEKVKECQRKTRIKKKKELIDRLGGKCSICGYCKNFKALCFHHKDPSIKKFSIAENILKKWEEVKEEVKKCELICSNCHIELHDRLFKESE